MITVSKDKRKTVKHFYADESDHWHVTVHKRGGTIDENIEDTLKTINPSSVMYEVWDNDELAAFFVVYKGPVVQGLEGFHIAKKYRNKDFFNAFWKEVKGHFKGEITMGLCSRNTEAMTHVLRQGFEVTNSNVIDGKIYVLLVHKNEKPCPSRWGSQEQPAYSN